MGTDAEGTVTALKALRREVTDPKITSLLLCRVLTRVFRPHP